MNQASIRNAFLGVAIGGLLLGSMTQALAQQPPPVPKFSFHGKPFYPIALYNYPVAGGGSSQSVSSLKEMAAAGFNTLLQYDHDASWEPHQPPVTPAFLSTAQTYGLSIVDELWTYNINTDDWIAMPSMYVPGSALARQVNLLKAHPDLLGYETFDEAAGYHTPKSYGFDASTEAQLRQGYDFVKSLDPKHPILNNENPISASSTAEADRKWAAIGDTYSCDWYPVDPTWTKPPWPLHGVANNMDYLYEVTDANGVAPFTPTKPIYMILQGCPISGVAPSYSDCRNIMYRTIIHGGVASLWWGTYQLKPTDQLWLDIKRCAGQLRDLEPVLENGSVLGVVRSDAATSASYSSPYVRLGDPNLEAIAYRRYNAQGTIDDYIIVANTSPTATVTSSIRVAGWNSSRNGNKTRVLFETDSNGNNRAMIPASGDTWSDTFAPNEVHVYTDRKFTDVMYDFDGDGIKDRAAYDPVKGELEITYSSNGKVVYQQCGISTRVVAADVDGDGKTDIAVYDPSTDSYRVWLSTTNYTTSRIMKSVQGPEFYVLGRAAKPKKP